MKIGIVGATGQVGSLMKDLVASKIGKDASVKFYATKNSAGKRLEYLGDELEVEDCYEADYSDLDYVLMSCGKDASKLLAPQIAEAGATIIDNSSAFRMDPDVPLVVYGVNEEQALLTPKKIIANPNCTTMVAMPVLKTLHDLFFLKSFFAVTFQAASGAGRGGIQELKEQVGYLADRDRTLTFGPFDERIPYQLFPDVLAFNVVPLAGDLTEDVAGETTEEAKLVLESRKILGLPELEVYSFCTRVSVFTGHSLAIFAQFLNKVNVNLAKEKLAENPEIELSNIPSPLKATGKDKTLVGRFKTFQSQPNTLAFFLTGDNLRKGAALNAVQILEFLETNKAN